MSGRCHSQGYIITRPSKFRHVLLSAVSEFNGGSGVLIDDEEIASAASDLVVLGCCESVSPHSSFHN